MNDAMQTFLSTLGKKTGFNWKRGIELFTQWYGKDVDTILAERKDDLTPRPNESLVDQKQRADRFEKKLEEFHKWLLEERNYKINTARTYVMGILQLFRYYSMGITLRTGSPLSQTTVSTGDFNLKPKHVRAMFHSAKDLRSKLMMSMANDLGCGIGDFITIEREELPDLNQQAPIYWEGIRGKTKQIIKTCLSETTVTLLKEYLFSFPKEDNPYLFHSNGSHISDTTVNQRLRDLARDADIKIGNKSLHFHCFRKMVISQAKNLGIDADIIRVMTGKSVNKAMLTYMTDINVKEAFQKLQTVTAINGTLIKPETENQLATLGKTVSDMQDKIEAQDKKIKELEDKLRNLPKLFHQLATKHKIPHTYEEDPETS